MSLREMPVEFTRGDLERTLPQFVGTLAQLPPRHSALKFQGRNYYEYARAGIEIPRVAREVTVHEIALIDWTPPAATLRVACGKGTYIRTLAEDIAVALGTCAHLSALRRTRTGPFTLDQAVRLDALETMDSADRDALLLPAHAPLAEMRRLDVDGQTARALREGRIGPAPAGAAGRYCCFEAGGGFLGIVDVDNAGIRADPPRPHARRFLPAELPSRWSRHNWLRGPKTCRILNSGPFSGYNSRLCDGRRHFRRKDHSNGSDRA